MKLSAVLTSGWISPVCADCRALRGQVRTTAKMDTAGALKEITGEAGHSVHFQKQLHDRANRSSGTSFRSPGREELEIMANIKA